MSYTSNYGKISPDYKGDETKECKVTLAEIHKLARETKKINRGVENVHC
jgi:hypothetical protein